MKRLAALLLVLCGGCSSISDDNLLWDSLFGDIRQAVSREPAANPYVPATNWYSTAAVDPKSAPPAGAVAPGR